MLLEGTVRWREGMTGLTTLWAFFCPYSVQTDESTDSFSLARHKW